MNTVVFTTYFSKKVHPQFGDPQLEGVASDGRAKQEDISYVGRWYESMNKLGIQGRIFYDNLSEEFIQKYTTKFIQFVRVETSDYSYNDWRFFCYRNYLDENKFDSVFMTDGSDVIVASDPSKVFEKVPDAQYFVGKDSIMLWQFPYLQNHNPLGFDNYFEFFIHQYEWDLINVGAIGARYDEMVLFLELICDERMRIGQPALNLDIWTGNYVFRHKLAGYKVVIGEPLTSNFKKYEYDRTDVAFIHK